VQGNSFFTRHLTPLINILSGKERIVKHMANSGLSGPYTLTAENIDLIVVYKSPGAYALGHLNSEGGYIIDYVGRSDSDINNRLKSWVNKGYNSFKYGYFNSPLSAFEKECTLYHDFGNNRNNKEHPARPVNSYWLCPVCSFFR